jgi:prophage tail gpP-like protein
VADDPLRLVLGGRRFEGWKKVAVELSIQAGCGAFDLQVSVRQDRAGFAAVEAGEASEIRIGDDLVITGYVDQVDRQIDAQEHQISVAGRDKVADLVDCCPDVGNDTPAEWRNVNIAEVAQQLAKPFGIAVRVDVDTGARLERVAINPGQTAYEVIERLCRYRQLLPISDGRGSLLLTRGGTRRASSELAIPGNGLRARFTDSRQDRFSAYTAKGQSFDLLGSLGIQAATAVGRAKDPQISRFRPLLLVADNAVDSGQCEERARWEALTRAARGKVVEFEVRGWRQQSGELWPLNALVPARCATLGISGEFLIVGVAYILDDGGARTRLRLMRKDAFQVLREPEVSAVPDFLGG